MVSRLRYDRYALHWLLGWPDEVHSDADLADADVTRDVRQDLALTPQLLRLSWHRRREVHSRAWHETAQQLALFFCDGKPETYARHMQTATTRWSLERCVIALRAARRQANAHGATPHRFREAVAANRLRLSGALNDKRRAPSPSREPQAPGTVRVHTYQPATDSHLQKGRERDRHALRETLAEPKALAGPRDRHACDELFAALYAESPWLAEPLSYLWRAALSHVRASGSFRLPPIILTGLPGCGKTHFAERLGHLSGCAPLRLDMSTSTSAFLVTGSEYTWSSSDPGRPIQHVAKTGIANPVVILDELDKRGGGGTGGDAADALLPLLQLETARTFSSPYLGAPVDLSCVSWIICVNDPERLPNPLRDRARVLPCSMPRGDHLRLLVTRILGPETDPAVIDMATHAVETGRSLRWLQRVSAQLRAITEAPMLH